ncbi:hypothetical protein MMC30_006798 [Trapelia coarctata]|nr:hypothetical protein [Trapelia coarctata]
MDPNLYLVRMAQVHPTFRKPELEALALMAGVEVEFVQYSEYSPYCILRLSSPTAAHTLLTRSILSKAIYHLWATAPSYPALHTLIQTQTTHLWSLYTQSTFKFTLDVFNGSHSAASQTSIINSFAYLPFHGLISMNHPEEEFVVCEELSHGNGTSGAVPQQIYFGRLIARGGRDAINTYSLKKRAYISTTSMDAELALLMANLAFAGPGKLFYDPFVGTGSLVIACAHYGACVMGSDLDGRAVRGKGGRGVGWSLGTYGLGDWWVDGFVGDVTFSPLRGVDGAGGVEIDGGGGGEVGGAWRRGGWLDGIVCDPPYGVREGLKVLGSRDGGGKEVVWIDGEMAHLKDKYIPPRRPYSFEALLSDILAFAANMLVEDGRLGMWMPTANEEEVELMVPEHEALELVSVCVQPFNKWSRRLLTYRRKREGEILRTNSQNGEGNDKTRAIPNGVHANDLNNFRKRVKVPCNEIEYFQGFKSIDKSAATTSTAEDEIENGEKT